MNLDQKCAEVTQEKYRIAIGSGRNRIRKAAASLELNLMKGYKKQFYKYINEHGRTDEWGRGTGDGCCGEDQGT